MSLSRSFTERTCLKKMLQEREEIATKRKYCKEVPKVLQQALWTLDEMPFECDISSKSSSRADDATGLPRGQALSPSIHAIASSEFGAFGSTSSYMTSTRNAKSRKSSHSFISHYIEKDVDALSENTIDTENRKDVW